MKYKIVKETRYNNPPIFYILKKRRFLFWTWWSRVKTQQHLIEPKYLLFIDYHSYNEAKQGLDRLLFKPVITDCTERKINAEKI